MWLYFFVTLQIFFISAVDNAGWKTKNGIDSGVIIFCQFHRRLNQAFYKCGFRIGGKLRVFS